MTVTLQQGSVGDFRVSRFRTGRARRSFNERKTHYRNLSEDIIGRAVHNTESYHREKMENSDHGCDRKDKGVIRM